MILFVQQTSAPTQLVICCVARITGRGTELNEPSGGRPFTRTAVGNKGRSYWHLAVPGCVLLAHGGSRVKPFRMGVVV